MRRRCHCGHEDHRLHLRPREGRELDAEVLVVVNDKPGTRGGGKVYLMVGRPGADPIVVDGAHRLRQIARALLNELGER